MASSGYRQPPHLVRRADGQTLQLTPTLYIVLEAIDGERGTVAIADVLAERHHLEVAPEDVEFVIEEKLRPLGVLQGTDGCEPTVNRSNPLLALRGRKAMADADTTIRLADRVTFLFKPPVALAIMVAFVASSWWLFVDKGLGDATRQVLYQPGVLLVVVALTLVSAAFHELGHAAACRYGGARPGVIGAALYLVWPAFYTDVTDSYRLSRRGRLRVDLGGLYFNAVFSVGSCALWLVTRWDPLIVLMFLQLVQMLRQLVPLVRFDGYHILADLVGVPDLFARIKPVLLGLLPTRWGSPENKVLKPWARAVVTLWVAVVVPVLGMSLLAMIVTLPRLVATAWDSLGIQWKMLVLRWSEADLGRVMLGFISMFAIALPVFSVSYLLFRIGRRTARRIWRASDDDRALRTATVIVAGALLVAAAAAWWPNGQYRPIQADEALTVPSAVQDVVGLGTGATPASLASIRPAQPERTTPSWVTIPVHAAVAGPAAPADRARFTPPAPPGQGDNQALAVNYADGTSIFDVALSLIWATSGEVTNTNQAYALASCRDCNALAVAFQLVLILDEASVVVPGNEAVAVNALCDGCVTQALAMQLVLTLSGQPDPATLAQLDAIWARLTTLTQALDTMSFEQTAQALAAVKTEIVALLQPYVAIAGVAEDVADGTASAVESLGSTTTSTTTPSQETTTTTAPDESTTSTTASDGTTTSTTARSGETTTSTTPDASTTTTTPSGGTTTTTAPASG
jgi:putative peptide zinc metalloprotease protein